MTVEIFRSPDDAISQLHFCPFNKDSEFLIVSSWDNYLRLYNTTNNLLNGIMDCKAPLLSCCFIDNAHRAAAGGLSKEVRIYDFVGEKDTLLGIQRGAINSFAYNIKRNLLLSGSWDKSVCAWDLRAKNLCHKIIKDGKILSICVTPENGPYEKLIVVDSSLKVYIHDFRKIEAVEETRENLSNYQFSCVKAFSTGFGFAIGTVEGRVLYQYFDPEKNATKNVSIQHPEILKNVSSYTFKCHRSPLQQEDLDKPCFSQFTPGVTSKVYSVNDISFHPKFNTFATAGSDGTIAFWNGEKKKRLWRLVKPFQIGIKSISFDSTGEYLAMALSADCDILDPQNSNVNPNQAKLLIHKIKAEDIKGSS